MIARQLDSLKGHHLLNVLTRQSRSFDEVEPMLLGKLFALLSVHIPYVSTITFVTKKCDYPLGIRLPP